jgi:saccharopine dehydrogenase (NAD+, L-lysine forming)
MIHLWLRTEHRDDEARTGLMPEGAAALIAQGFTVTVEDSPLRVIPAADYAAAGARIAPQGSWPGAPDDALIFGLKELPDDHTPLRHRHILFGHAFKGQPGAARLLARFRAGGGVLYDLEALVDEQGRRVAAFGYWAGYAGAAVSLLAWAAQARGGRLGPVDRWADRNALRGQIVAELGGLTAPRALVIGALGRVGTGAADLCEEAGVPVTRWDQAETAHGGPFPQVAEHGVLFNCILARPDANGFAPVFAPRTLLADPRTLRVIGDIACDPGVPYSPVPLYDRATTWAEPVVRVHDHPVLDIMAIDNLPSLLPRESAQDFAAQLLPHLTALNRIDAGVWGRARATFETFAG